MLYDPKWKADVTADPFKLSTLIAWLEKQPAHKGYCYLASGGCLLHQYFTACGFKKVTVGGYGVSLNNIEYPLGDFENIPNETPHTFGAALERARKVATQ